MSSDGISELLAKALDEGLFTGADLLVGAGEEIVFHRQVGTLAGPSTPKVTARTLFDLASLTKVVATTPSWMVLASENPHILDEPIGTWFRQCPKEKQRITPRLLLGHCSGLPAWRPYYLFATRGLSRLEFTVERILAEPLEYQPGQDWIYSDLGFMLLGFILELQSGMAIDRYARKRVFHPLGLSGELIFRPDETGRTSCTRQGEPPGLVNDLNARALGRVAGHAGLFGSALAVYLVAKTVLLSLNSDAGYFSRSITREFCARTGLGTSSTRALGFDTPSKEGSSCGRFFSSKSIGHTGFTGTSLWMDPDRSLIVVFLTNRVFMGESDFRIKELRPLIHDAVIESLAGT